MPRSTPARAEFNVDDLDDEVALGGDPPPPLFRTAAEYTATSEVAGGGLLVYTHGCSLRVRFKCPTARVLEVLPRCGWAEDASLAIWRSSKPGLRRLRWVMKGSKWLDERAPGNPRLALGNMNRGWKTRVYSLAIERSGDAFSVDLQVVRHGDIRRFMETVLGLSRDEYEAAYYRTIERYTVVPPHVAFALAEALGAVPKVGSARQSKKRWLVKDYEIPITIRTSTRTKAQLVVYRIFRGATAHFKIEVRLRGKRQDRGQFHDADVGRLDEVLLDIVKTHDLQPIPSPARWEPRTFTSPVELGPFDPFIRQLPQRAWRGTRVSDDLKRTVKECHTPSPAKGTVTAGDDGSFHRAARIRSDKKAYEAHYAQKGGWKRVEGGGFEIAHYVYDSGDDESQQTEPIGAMRSDPYLSTAADIAKSGLYLHEVVLDPEDDPRRLLRALGGGLLGTIGVTACCAVGPHGPETWQSVVDATKKHPFEDDGLDTLVLVVDPTAVLDVMGAFIGGSEPEMTEDGDVVGDLENLFVAGPLAPTAFGMEVTHKAMAGRFADMLEELRRIGEEGSVRVIVVTCDARPDHALGGMQRKHYFRDGRVRSSIGDAGRYSAHQRYRIERVNWTHSTRERTEERFTEDGDRIIEHHHASEHHESVAGNVVVLKDEAEGLPGRLIFKSSFIR